MPVCEICGLEVVEVHVCSECEAKFCSECGDVQRKLCYDCKGWRDGSLDESWDYDDEDWGRTWSEDEPH
jgi:hypothetical protein